MPIKVNIFHYINMYIRFLFGGLCSLDVQHEKAGTCVYMLFLSDKKRSCNCVCLGQNSHEPLED